MTQLESSPRRRRELPHRTNKNLAAAHGEKPGSGMQCTLYGSTTAPLQPDLREAKSSMIDHFRPHQSGQSSAAVDQDKAWTESLLVECLPRMNYWCTETRKHI